MGLLTGMGASVMMQTAVAATLPTISNDLGSMELYAWVFGAYMLAATITIPLFGGLSDILGRRFVYLFGMGCFLFGTLAAGLAEGMPQLVAARVVQGIGAGALAPAALAAVGDLFPAAERGRVFGAFGVFSVLSTLAGPLFGSWVTAQLGWRWTFFAVLPVGLLAVTLAAIGLPGRSKSGQQALDWPGALWTGASLLLLLGGVHAMAKDVAGIAGSIAALSGFVSLVFALRYEVAHDSPAVPVRLMKKGGFGQAALGATLLGCITHGAIAFVPLIGPEVGVARSAERLLPMLLAAGFGSLAAGRLSAYLRFSIPAAWLAALVSFVLFAQSADSPAISATIAAAVIGFCTGLLLPLYLAMATDATDAAERGSASGMVQLARNLGGGVGVPLLGIHVGAGTPSLAFAFAGLAIVCSLALLLSLVLVRHKTHAANISNPVEEENGSSLVP